MNRTIPTGISKDFIPRKIDTHIKKPLHPYSGFRGSDQSLVLLFLRTSSDFMLSPHISLASVKFIK